MKLFVALLVITAACALSPNAASAQGPFCLRGCDFGTGECTFSSYAQCQASAAGRTAWCEANPDYHPVNALQPTGRPKMSRRNF